MHAPLYSSTCRHRCDHCLPALLPASHLATFPAVSYLRCSDVPNQLVLYHAQVGPAIGSYALASRLVGFVYDRSAEAQGYEPSGGSHTCRGDACFRAAFLGIAAAAVAASACAAALHVRQAGRYAAMWQRLKQQRLG